MTEHLNLVPSQGQGTQWLYTMFAHSFINVGEVCTPVLFHLLVSNNSSTDLSIGDPDGCEYEPFSIRMDTWILFGQRTT